MRLDITIELDSGGTVTITGENLTAEGANEVFALLGGYSIVGGTELEPRDGPVTEDMREAFVEGFDEGRAEQAADEFKFYADPANREPQGPPVQRTEQQQENQEKE